MTIGLVDANNFYVSCERAFDPALKRIPVVVLSNNDGCVISRSQEAKDMGVGMGEPWFKLEKQAQEKGIRARSSNYPLYGDMSRRIYEVLRQYSPLVEPYSIDEMFIDLTGISKVDEYAQAIRTMILRKTKIPTCIGIGETKTKAKMANRIAKDHPEFAGVCDLQRQDLCARFYPELEIEQVWGIGRGMAKKLRDIGYSTVGSLISMDERKARKILTVTGARIVMELRGISCFPLSAAVSQRKAVMVSRTFGRPVSDLRSFCSALSSFTSMVGEKLRRQKLHAVRLRVFTTKSKHAQGEYHEVDSVKNILPTNDTLTLNREVLGLARKIWQEGHRYAKAGISVEEVRPETSQLGAEKKFLHAEKLMTAVDQINQRYGKNSIRTAAMKEQLESEKKRPPKKTRPRTAEEWEPLLNLHSSAYTTRVNELMKVKT